MSRYALDTPGATASRGDSAQLFKQVPGLLQKGFPAKPQDPDSKYSDPLYYLPFIPTLDTESDHNITPPLGNPDYLLTTHVIDVGDRVLGVTKKMPWDLRHLPVSRSDADQSIEVSIIPGKYNSDDKTGQLRWSRRHFMLVMRVDGDEEAHPAVLMLGAKQMFELCTQLALHRKYVPDLTGMPLYIRAINKTVVVDPVTDESRLDMSVLKPVNDEGASVLETYIDTVRRTYEDYLLENGYTCQVADDGQRMLWRIPGVGESTAPLPVADDGGEPPWATNVATEMREPSPADEFEDYSKAQLQEVIDAAGIKVAGGSRASRDAMIEAIVAARS